MVGEQLKTVYENLKGTFGYTNVMQAPRLAKVVISVGTGKLNDKTRVAFVQDRLAKITGQKLAARPAKKSVASFKLREGDIVGYQATLRGARAVAFLDKLVHVALPNTRDFRGLKVGSIDDMGNYTLGVTEHTIFPECHDDELKDIFGFAVTIVTTAKTKPETEAFLRHVGLPLQK